MGGLFAVTVSGGGSLYRERLMIPSARFNEYYDEMAVI